MILSYFAYCLSLLYFFYELIRLSLRFDPTVVFYEEENLEYFSIDSDDPAFEGIQKLFDNSSSIGDKMLNITPYVQYCDTYNKEKNKYEDCHKLDFYLCINETLPMRTEKYDFR